MLGRTRSACEEGDAVTRPVMLKVATYNKPGQHMEKRMGGSRNKGHGTGRDLATKPGTGMKTALELATADSFDVYVATETRTREEEWEAVRGAWDMAGYEIDGTCGAIKDGATSGHTVGGVTIAWRKETIRRKQETTTIVIVPTRVVQIELEIDTATTVSVYEVYMPMGGATKAETKVAWKDLRDAILADAHEHIWVIGDMNAVTKEWRNQRGSRPGEADTQLDNILEACQLTPLGIGVATHADGRKIDHILEDNSSRARYSTAIVMPADTDTDHSIVCVEITTSAKADGIREQRPRGQPLHEWEDAQYKKYYENMEAWQISEGKSDMDSETHEASTEECIHTIEEMQQAMTTAAKKLDETRRRAKPQEERGPNDSSKEKQPDKLATQGTATADTQKKKRGPQKPESNQSSYT